MKIIRATAGTLHNLAPTRRIQTLLATTFAAAFSSIVFAQPVAGGNNNPVDIAQDGFCGADGVIGIITNPALVGIALALLMVYFGWAIKTGNGNATQIVMRGLTGAIVVLSGVAIASSFVGGCP